MKKTIFKGALSATALVGLLAVISSSSVAQQTPGRSIIALSKGEHVLAIVDPETLKIVAKVPVGPDPHEVVASSDGTTAYVSNMGNGDSHEVDVIDLIRKKALPNIDTRPLYGPHGITFADGKVWFTAQDSKSVGRYDPVAGSLDWCMGTGQNWTHMLYVTPDGKKIYTTNVRSGTVSIFEYGLQPQGRPPMGKPFPDNKPQEHKPFPGGKPHWDWTQTVVPVSKGSEGFDVSPDGREIWTAAADDGIISIIDTASKSVVASIDAKVIGANRVKFTPDGKYVFISSLRSGDLFIYDAASRKEFKRITIGHGAAGILMDPSGMHAFVACTGDDYIAEVDLKKMELTGRRIELGGPDGMEWAIRK
jgi:DNA-binding beta-propeller fold protein YncE